MSLKPPVEDAGGKITYKEMEAIYRKASEGNVFPPYALTTESSIRRIFGDEVVDRGLADGTITYFHLEEEEEDAIP
jgi:hypothetical protein